MSLAEQTEVLLSRLRQGQGDALGELFSLYRDRLWRMASMRLDRRLSGRIDPDDILQEVFLDVARRVGEYLQQPTVPFYVWLRFLTIQRLQMAHRNHLGARMRTVGREVSLSPAHDAPASADVMAGALISQLTSPSVAVMRSEMQARLRDALDALDPLDREVLALRHFEELSNAEAAEVLGISREAASKRHVRALSRLREVLAAFPGAFPG